MAGKSLRKLQVEDIELSVYHSAQESARHSDILMWQVTAIIWGADILLLGFVLEAIGKDRAAPITKLAISILGIALSVFVAHFFDIAKISQGIAYEICRDIEAEVLEKKRPHLCLHTRINDAYERAVLLKAKYCVRIITALFLIFWAGILLSICLRLPHS